MILKDLDPFSSTDPLLCAGRKTEEQMVFYLRRSFEGDRQVRVFNSLRFVSDGDVAQIASFNGPERIAGSSMQVESTWRR